MSNGGEGKHEACEECTREEIEEKIARGLAQLENGESVDGEEFFEQLRQRSIRRRER
jgi:predicted transcriptional regulator